MEPARYVEGPVGERTRRLIAVLEKVLSVERVAGVDPVIALDFYKAVEEGVPPMEWRDSEPGRLIHRAKYWQDRGAFDQLADWLGEVAERHPILAAADIVASVPDSRKPTSIGIELASAVAKRLAKPLVGLRDTADVHDPAKGSEAKERSFACETDLKSQRVLIVDDVVRHGSTLTAAGRALRASGAVAVAAVVGARTVSG